MSIRSNAGGALGRGCWAAAVVAAVVAGCSTASSPESPSQETPSESPWTASPSDSDAGSSEEAAEDASPAAPPEHPDPTDPASPLPTWDAAATEQAQARAVAFVRAFVRTDLSEEDWYAGIRGFLSEEAQDNYLTVDQRNFPSTEITGDAQLVDDSSVFIAIVEVPTSAGVFAVTLSRSEAGQDWDVEGAELLE